MTESPSGTCKSNMDFAPIPRSSDVRVLAFVLLLLERSLGFSVSLRNLLKAKVNDPSHVPLTSGLLLLTKQQKSGRGCPSE